MKDVFDTVGLRNLQLKNRLVRSATWEALATRDGKIDEQTYQIYRELADGGVGLIITGFTSVDTDDVYFEGMMRLADDDTVPQYLKLTDEIHARGGKIITQLALGGYYLREDDRLYERQIDDMTKEDIQRVIEMFRQVALRAERAGFDGVQIHVAHFFFLSRFVSPLFNHRNDEYGGTSERRARIVIAIIKAIRETTPHLHISMKINGSDFTPGGNTPKDAVLMSELYAEAGADSIEISGNGTSVGSIHAHRNEAYFLPIADAVAQATEVPVILVGGLRSVDTMNTILNETKVQLLSLSRPLIREPNLPNLWKQDTDYIPKCVSCNGCYHSEGHRCVFSKQYKQF